MLARRKRVSTLGLLTKGDQTWLGVEGKPRQMVNLMAIVTERRGVGVLVWGIKVDRETRGSKQGERKKQEAPPTLKLVDALMARMFG